jgi:hypothetical protein
MLFFFIEFRLGPPNDASALSPSAADAHAAERALYAAQAIDRVDENAVVSSAEVDVP